jgi:hypothetical protein
LLCVIAFHFAYSLKCERDSALRPVTCSFAGQV